jgi:hypothetical protein
MAYAYDANQRLLPLAFIVADEESTDNLGWFMNRLRTEIVGPEKI